MAVKYLILIYSNPASRDVWETLPSAQRLQGLAAYTQLNEDLEASGEMIVSNALADPSLTKRVLARDGQAIITDGPFAEAKELLAGFIFLECESMERAVEYAARVPEAGLGLVEVRPTMDLSAFEM